MVSYKRDLVISSRFWPSEKFEAFFNEAQKKRTTWFGVSPKTLSKFPVISLQSPHSFSFSHLTFDESLHFDFTSAKEIELCAQNLLALAAQAKAKKIPILLLDCFEIPTPNASERFEKLLQGLREEGEKAKETLVQWSADRSSEHEEMLLALCRIFHYLLKREEEVQFCLSPRYCLNQVPNLKEMTLLFEELHRFPRLAYWHHLGHAYLQEKLGVSTQEDWIAQFRHKMCGITIQDATGYQIGLPPGVGDVSFDLLKELPDSCQQTLELSKESSWPEYELGISHLNYP